MTIKKTSEDADKIILELDNGHLEALKKIKDDYKIKDLEKALGFALAVISKGNGAPIGIGTDTFLPGQAIKESEKEKEPEVESKPITPEEAPK